jgi:thymidine kinase
MFAGKSTELLRRVRKHEIAGKRCLYIKFIEDTRYDVQSIATHDNLKRQAVAVKQISEVGDDWKSFDVIGIDEGQFFTDIV